MSNTILLPPLVEDTDLLTKVKSLELGAFGKNKDLISRTYSHDALLEEAYNVRCPGPYEHGNRRNLIRIFNVIAKELFGNDCPVVEEFGSFVMNMFSSESDLDLSINFNNGASAWSKKKRVNALRSFAKKFRSLQGRGLVKDVLLVPTARVPVLKVTDRATNIECDFSVENRDGVTKSHIVYIIATIDERLRKLSIMLKAWAKAHSINSSKDGSLNSLSLILLAAFHLQRTEPPILPPFCAFLNDGFDLPTVRKNVAPYLNYGEKNKESLIQLFVTLLIRLKSVETLWSEGLCASVYEGSWIYKRFKNKLGICVEDFTDRSQNVARALNSKKVPLVHHAIDKSLAQIQNFLDGKIQWNLLERSLFGLRPPRMTKNIITLQTTPNHPVSYCPFTTMETQLAPNQEVGPPCDEGHLVLDKKKKKKQKKRKRKETEVQPRPTPPMKRVMIPDAGGALQGERTMACEVETTEKRRNYDTVQERRRRNLVSSKSEIQPQSQPPPRKQVIIPDNGHRSMSYEVEAFERRVSYNTTHNPSVYMYNYAPAFGHEAAAASSSQSFAAYPPTVPYPSHPAPFRNIPSHRPSQSVARFPPSQSVARYPPIRDPVYDPYYPRHASHNVYRVALSSYPVGREHHHRTPEVPYSREREHYRTPEVPYSREREHYRTPEVPYSGEREHYRTPEVPYSGEKEHYGTPEVPYSGVREHYRTPEAPYPGRMEQIWSDYSREVREEVPYPGHAQTWGSNRPDEAPRGASGTPLYR